MRAIILLTDGDYNWLGDFLGRGTGYYPPPPTGYTGSSPQNLEPEEYLYYPGLGGSLIPVAYFTATNSKLTVQFTDKSLGNPTSWNWSFGDGSLVNATMQNPVHTYASGTKNYQVSEKVTTSAGSNTATSNSNYVQVSGSSLTIAGSNVPSVPPYYTTAPDEQLTNQNLSVYAYNNGIRVYTIGYANSFDSQAVTDMNVLSNATGGFYAPAPTAAQLQTIYTQIAGNLQIAAGVNTQMTMNFQNVMLNNVSVPNANAFTYVAANPGSTDITWQNGVTNNTNQMAQWQTNKTLIFNIGTINLGQTWQAVFELNITQAGDFQLFGNQSGTITFNNGTSFLQLPGTSFTALANLTNDGATEQSILLSPIQAPQSEIVTDFIPLQWSTTMPATATAPDEERLYYSTSEQPASTCGNAPWVGPFDTQQGIPIGTLSTQNSSLDVRSLPPGTYYVCVDATAGNAYPATAETISGVTVKESGKTYIQLQ